MLVLEYCSRKKNTYKKKNVSYKGSREWFLIEYIYIYIYIKREREKIRYTQLYKLRFKRDKLCRYKYWTQNGLFLFRLR